MAVQTDAIQAFLAEARRIVAQTPDDAKKLEALTPLLQRLAATPDVLAADQMVSTSTERATRHTLHEAPDHSLALWAVVWPTGYSTLPHNHHTWAVVVGRFSPRSRIQPGDEVVAVVDTRALHFFDPATGAGIYDETPPRKGETT